MLEVTTNESITGRSAKRLRAEIAPNKRAETLLGNIEKHVDPSAQIETDGLAAYRGLTKRGYQHYAVNRSKGEWVKDGATTNTIEGVHSTLKKRIRNQNLLNGQKSESPAMKAKINEIVYRFNHRDVEQDFFHHFLSLIALNYPF